MLQKCCHPAVEKNRKSLAPAHLSLGEVPPCSLENFLSPSQPHHSFQTLAALCFLHPVPLIAVELFRIVQSAQNEGAPLWHFSMKLTACSKAHALSLTKRHSKYNTHCKESNSFHSFFHQVEIICNRLMLPRYTEGYKPKWKWFTPCETAWIKLITHLLDYYLLHESSVMWLYPHRQHHGSTEWLSYIWTLCREQNLVLSSFPPPRQMLMHLDKTPPSLLSPRLNSSNSISLSLYPICFSLHLHGPSLGSFQYAQCLHSSCGFTRAEWREKGSPLLIHWQCSSWCNAGGFWLSLPQRHTSCSCSYWPLWSTIGNQPLARLPAAHHHSCKSALQPELQTTFLYPLKGIVFPAKQVKNAFHLLRSQPHGCWLHPWQHYIQGSPTHYSFVGISIASQQLRSNL